MKGAMSRRVIFDVLMCVILILKGLTMDFHGRNVCVCVSCFSLPQVPVNYVLKCYQLVNEEEEEEKGIMMARS